MNDILFQESSYIFHGTCLPEGPRGIPGDSHQRRSQGWLEKFNLKQVYLSRVRNSNLFGASGAGVALPWPVAGRHTLKYLVTARLRWAMTEDGRVVFIEINSQDQYLCAGCA